MAPQDKIISPLYLLNSDTRYIDSTNMHLELCIAMDMVVKGRVATAQLIKGLWHLFTTTEESKNVLLEKGISIKSTKLKLLNTITIPEYHYTYVESAIHLLKNSSAGFDQIPTNIVKQCIPLYIHPLTFLINFSLRTGQFPDLMTIWESSTYFQNEFKYGS